MFKIAPHFKELKGIYKADAKAKILEGSQDFQEYVKYLKEQGLWMNSISLALFETKNKLQYPGLMATDNIPAGDVLVKVPKKLMLNTKKGYYSDIQQIFDEWPQFFSSYHSGSWQDRILLTYILRQFQLGKQSEWYHLIHNLPRDIDYLIFWEEQEMTLLQDPQMIKNALKERAEFELMAKTLQVILQKYPQFFNPETYCYDNIKWIHIHLVSRCFGSNIAQVAFVPFCEFLNHENTDVRYTGHYNPDNKFKNDAKELQEIVSSDESDGEKDDQIDSDDEYPEWMIEKVREHRQRIPTYKLIEQEIEQYKKTVNYKSKEDVQKLEEFQIKQGNRTELQILFMKYKRWLQENLNLVDNYSLIFVEKIIVQMKFIVGQYDQDIINFAQAQQQFDALSAKCHKYLEIVQLHQRPYELKQFDPKEKNEEPQSVEDILEQKVVTNVDLYDKYENWIEDRFDDFIIKCSKKDYFEKGAQVYFCYGAESNRLLLMRYGFALEYNRFEHLFLKIPILFLENTLDVIEYFKIPKYARFKIKYTRLCKELLLFFKLQFWKYDEDLNLIFSNQRDGEAAQQAIKYLKEEQVKLNITNMDLQNEKLGYHEYFAQVYVLERFRVLQCQIEYMEALAGKKDLVFPWSQRVVSKYLGV